MKRCFALMLSLLLTAASIVTCALAEAVPAQQSQPLKAGDVLYGFRVLTVRPFDLFHANVVHMEHEKTGAQLLFFDCEDTNRAFSIAFNTPTTDDKGLPHVFEHSALSGSDKYPDPNLVFSMMYGTYTTYMNAGTYQTMTVYPNSSLSEEQLMVNMDVYLSGVFHPVLLRDERAMMREACRYELNSEEDDIALTGTVYSEMLGAVDLDRMASYNLNRLLYPGSFAASESGGLPDAIETMTHQDLLDFHQKWYTPSNALIVLYGDLEIGRFLERLDTDYLSEYDRVPVDLTDAGYKPVSGQKEGHYTFPASADAPRESRVLYAVPLFDSYSTEDLEVLSIALDLLNREDRYLDTELRNRLPGANVSVSLNMLAPDPAVVFKATGVAEEQADLFRQIVDEAIAYTLENGFSPEDIAADVASLRYETAEIAEESYGISMARAASYYWAAARDPLAVLDLYQVIENLEDYEAAGAFDAAFRRAFSQTQASVFAVTTAEPGKQEQQEAERAQRLREMKESMSGEEIQALIQKTADYNAWTEENAQNSMLSQVTAVDAQTLPEEVMEAEAADERIDGVRVVTSSVEDTDLIDIALYLDASGVPAEQLERYMLLTDLLGGMPTEHYDRAQLANQMQIYASGLSFSATTVLNEETDEWHPWFVISWKTFDDCLDESFALVREILGSTDLRDAQYLRSRNAAKEDDFRLSWQNSPHSLAFNYARAASREESAYRFRLRMTPFANYLASFEGMDDGAVLAECDAMTAVLDLLKNRDGAMIALSGSAAGIEPARERALELLADFGESERETADYSGILHPFEGNIAIAMDTGVQYNLEYLPFDELGIGYSGKLDAFTNMASDLVLIPTLRFQNSVYSVMSAVTETDAYVLTYRDPMLKKTFGELFPAIGGQVQEQAEGIGQQDLNGYITSAYQSLAAPVGPLTRARTAVADVLRARNSFEKKRAGMEALKAFVPEDVAEYAGIFDRLSGDGLKVSVASPAQIEENRELFETVETYFNE
ncbi:MAG: insulinase family protein [Clostridia bacterium]|nr:insulinase family protein [Clostridia bacterium]